MPSLENRTILLMLSVILLGLSCDPALANKFQTIGSGVTGSMKIKIEYLRVSAYVISALFFISSLLAATTKKKNAHELNFAVWKTSSIIFLVLSLIALVIALLL